MIIKPTIRQIFNLSYIYIGGSITTNPNFNIKAPILEPIIAPIYTNIYHQCSAKVKYPAAAITDNEPSNTDQPYSILSQLLSVQYFSASSSL